MGWGARLWKVWADVLLVEGTRRVGVLKWGRQSSDRLTIEHREKGREGSWILEDPVGQGRTSHFVLGVAKSLRGFNQSSVIC